MKNMKLEYHKISQKQLVDSAMLIFHGYGDSYMGFMDFAEVLSAKFPSMGFYVVNAPTPLFFGGYSWFDLNQDDFEAFETPDAAIPALNNLIARAPLSMVHDLTKEIAEKESISFDKMFYAGFSQGGLMSLVGSLTFDEKLAGAVAMSSVPLTFGDDFSLDEIKNTPDILLTHGTKDSVVPFVCLEMSKHALAEIGIVPEEKIVPNKDHNESITFEVIEKISEFIKTRGF